MAEIGLAQLIESEVNDPWEWLPLLSEENQVRVLGYWELSRRRRVDIGPLAARTLTQLLTTVAKTERLRERIGFKSRTEIDHEAGRVPDFRNRIMHPVRPLILGLEDVEMAYRVARFLEHLRNTLTPNEYASEYCAAPDARRLTTSWEPAGAVPAQEQSTLR